MAGDIRQYARTYHSRAERERADSAHLLVLTPYQIKAEQEHGRNADSDSSEQSSGHPEGPCQVRLPHAKDNQRQEFQCEAQSVNENIQRDQTLKAEVQTRRPSNRQSDNRDPGR